MWVSSVAIALGSTTKMLMNLLRCSTILVDVLGNCYFFRRAEPLEVLNVPSWRWNCCCLFLFDVHAEQPFFCFALGYLLRMPCELREKET